jgi:carboxymethylenebutenolidase
VHDVKEYASAGHSFLTESTAPPPLSAVAKIVMGLGAGRENAPDGWDRIFTFFDEHLRQNGSTT